MSYAIDLRSMTRSRSFDALRGVRAVPADAQQKAIDEPRPWPTNSDPKREDRPVFPVFLDVPALGKLFSKIF